MPDPLLDVRRLTKRFPGVVALKAVDFDVRPGEIHALCGENGAGKSTLIKLLSGIHPAGTYEGEIRVDGRPAAFRGVRDAEEAGIAVITQELALVPELTVAENLFLGREPRRGWRIDWPALRAGAARLIARCGVNLAPEARVRDLGVGQKQLVEIVRALGKESRILVLDEPTAALSDQETALLLGILRELRTRGTACIYISHRLEEVLAIADRITILRDGASIVCLPAADADFPTLVRHMVGRTVTSLFPRRPPPSGEPEPTPLLRVTGLAAAPRAGTPPFLQDLTFALRPGEVLGVGGLMGAGRTELLTHLFGSWGHRLAGTVELPGRAGPPPADPRGWIEAGMVLVSEDRRRYGLILEQSIGFNLSLSQLKRLCRGGKLDLPAEAVANRQWHDRLRIKSPGLSASVAGLSGGNQQKVILGRVLMTSPRVVLMDEPTRGIDVGAKLEVYELINELTAAGNGVLLVSSELPELMGMSDRIVMLHEGRIGGEFARAEFTQERLLAAALGRRAAA